MLACVFDSLPNLLRWSLGMDLKLNERSAMSVCLIASNLIQAAGVFVDGHYLRACSAAAAAEGRYSLSQVLSYLVLSFF